MPVPTYEQFLEWHAAQQTSAAPGTNTPSGGVVSGSQQEVSVEDFVTVLEGISGVVLAVIGAVVTIKTAQGQTVQVEAQEIIEVYKPPTNGNGNGDDWQDYALGGTVLLGLGLLIFLIARK